MRLKSVKIRNFRAISQLDIDLDPRLTVLIGDNAAGKTCILDAISVGLEAIAQRMRLKFKRRWHSQDIRRVGGQQALAAIIQLETLDDVIWDRGLVRDPTEETKREAEALFPRVWFKGLHGILDPAIAARSGGKDELPLPVIAYYGTERSVVKEIPVHREIDHELSPLQEGYAGALHSAVNFSRLLIWFEAMEAEELRRRRDEDPAWTHPQLAAVRQVVEAVIPGARNLRVSPKRRLEVDLREQDGHDEVLALNELSGGYRTVLALVADLARRMALINPALGTRSEAIVLIDEVDLHLHPRWQQTVLDSLTSAFPNVQFIVSTHSEQIIAAVEPKHVIRLDRTPDGVSLSRPTSTYGATPDRVSEDVMGLPHLRRKDVEDCLKKYWDLIVQGQGESEEALPLRRQLDAWFRGEEPEMLRADVEIKRQKLLGKLRREREGQP